ncbi:hypothetical protein MJL81_28715, partial [Salmonella enterica subsp. enterica serovar Anatum]|nr:hypothetical protein [Salmonella enterica subsp. enterica serovar Anatum]
RLGKNVRIAAVSDSLSSLLAGVNFPECCLYFWRVQWRHLIPQITNPNAKSTCGCGSSFSI